MEILTTQDGKQWVACSMETWDFLPDMQREIVRNPIGEWVFVRLYERQQ